MTDIDYNDSEGGLDESDSEQDTKIYLVTKDGMEYSYEPEYVQYIELVNCIMKGDSTCGTKDDPIPLTFISSEEMYHIDLYIKEHKGEDYIPNENDEEIAKKLPEWDIDFFKHILETNDKPLDQIYPNINKYIMAARYLMFSTFLSKLNCFTAHLVNIYVKRRDFMQLFSIEEESESEVEEDTDLVIRDQDEIEEKRDE